MKVAVKYGLFWYYLSHGHRDGSYSLNQVNGDRKRLIRTREIQDIKVVES